MTDILLKEFVGKVAMMITNASPNTVVMFLAAFGLYFLFASAFTVAANSLRCIAYFVVIGLYMPYEWLMKRFKKEVSV